MLNAYVFHSKYRMYWDLLITLWVSNMIWILTDYGYWIILWIPAYYGYKGVAQLKFFYDIFNAGRSQSNNEQVNNNRRSRKQKQKKKRRR